MNVADLLKCNPSVGGLGAPALLTREDDGALVPFWVPAMLSPAFSCGFRRVSGVFLRFPAVSGVFPAVACRRFPAVSDGVLSEFPTPVQGDSTLLLQIRKGAFILHRQSQDHADRVEGIAWVGGEILQGWEVGKWRAGTCKLNLLPRGKILCCTFSRASDALKVPSLASF